jgi:gamma-glutamyltranspeptidase/glutathione hydrolase
VVVVTYTLNGYFGANVIAGDTGFFLNNELDDFTSQPGVANYFGLIQGKANIIAPNKRPLSSIAPIIIFKNNKFFMAGGTPGGSTIPTTTIQTIENIIDYGLNIQTAVSTPKFHMQWLPDLVYREPYAFTLAVKQKLKSMGYHFKLGSPYGTLRWGAMVGIIYNIKTHQFEGAIDERKSSRMVRGY